MDENQSELIRKNVQEPSSRPGVKPDIPQGKSTLKEENVPEYTIKNIQEFINLIEDFVIQGFSFFRGDKNCVNYELVPNLFKKKNCSLIDHQETMINDFTFLSIGRNNSPTNGPFEEMLNAQHYELPTRLLDWTESALIALYFSVHNDPDKTREDSIVWVLNPSGINSHISFMSEIYHKGALYVGASYDSLDIELTTYYNSPNISELYPVAVKTRRINPRIDAQRGVFLIYCKNSDTKCLTKYNDANKFLRKINIDKKDAAKIQKQLESVGMTQYSLFPEMKSIAEDIVKRYKGGVK
jgi:hypothetical protein